MFAVVNETLGNYLGHDSVFQIKDIEVDETIAQKLEGHQL